MSVVRKTFQITGVLLVTLALASAGMTGLVLCIGADGHISIEATHAGHCHDSGGAGHDRDAAADADADDCCDGCTDMDLASEHLVPLTPSVRRDCLTSMEVAFCATIPFSFLGSAVLTKPAQPLSGTTAFPSPILLEQRTIVLRS